MQVGIRERVWHGWGFVVLGCDGDLPGRLRCSSSATRYDLAVGAVRAARTVFPSDTITRADRAQPGSGSTATSPAPGPACRRAGARTACARSTPPSRQGRAASSQVRAADGAPGHSPVVANGRVGRHPGHRHPPSRGRHHADQPDPSPWPPGPAGRRDSGIGVDGIVGVVRAETVCGRTCISTPVVRTRHTRRADRRPAGHEPPTPGLSKTLTRKLAESFVDLSTRSRHLRTPGQVTQSPGVDPRDWTIIQRAQ